MPFDVLAAMVGLLLVVAVLVAVALAWRPRRRGQGEPAVQAAAGADPSLADRS